MVSFSFQNRLSFIADSTVAILGTGHKPLRIMFYCTLGSCKKWSELLVLIRNTSLAVLAVLLCPADLNPFIADVKSSSNIKTIG